MGVSRAQIWGSVVKNGFGWGGAVAITYFGYRSVDALAGATTFADIGVNALAAVRVSTAVAWLLGAGGAGVGWRERRLRQAAVERMSQRIQELERQIDPNRTSSELSPCGDTHPVDRVL